MEKMDIHPYYFAKYRNHPFAYEDHIALIESYNPDLADELLGCETSAAGKVGRRRKRFLKKRGLNTEGTIWRCHRANFCPHCNYLDRINWSKLTFYDAFERGDYQFRTMTLSTDSPLSIFDEGDNRWAFGGASEIFDEVTHEQVFVPSKPSQGGHFAGAIGYHEIAAVSLYPVLEINIHCHILVATETAELFVRGLARLKSTLKRRMRSLDLSPDVHVGSKEPIDRAHFLSWIGYGRKLANIVEPYKRAAQQPNVDWNRLNRNANEFITFVERYFEDGTTVQRFKRFGIFNARSRGFIGNKRKEVDINKRERCRDLYRSLTDAPTP